MSHKSGAKPVTIIFILGALTTVSPVSIDMYLPSFPQIAAGLNTTVAKVSLSLSSYFVALAMGQLFYGPLLDRFGRKRPIYAGLCLYLLSSMGCLFSPSVEMLIGFRFLQGLGACAAQVAAVAMVRDFFPVEDTARIFALLMLILGVSPLLAPTAGGILTTHLGWASVFIFLAVIVTLILVATFLFLPEATVPDRAVSLRLKPILSTFAKIFRDPLFSTYAISGSFTFAGLFAYVAGSPTIFMDVFEVTPRGYGAIFALLSVGFIGGNQLTLWLARKFHSSAIYRFGTFGQAVTGVLFFLLARAGVCNLVTTLILLFLILAFVGLANPNANALALAPFVRNVGSAAALIGFMRIGAGAVVSSIVGVLGTGGLVPISAILAASAVLGAVTLMLGLRRKLRFDPSGGVNL